MATLLPDDTGLFQQDNTPCKIYSASQLSGKQEKEAGLIGSGKDAHPSNYFHCHDAGVIMLCW